MVDLRRLDALSLEGWPPAELMGNSVGQQQSFRMTKERDWPDPSTHVTPNAEFLLRMDANKECRVRIWYRFGSWASDPLNIVLECLSLSTTNAEE